ncbi:unnamed protein product [Notodromas monacha]|uniref:Ral guanine nucleotide dissociation stimulator-like 1 n=1 Tax=Notodromas monacha TaxID=399045 RepID=A0A7R9GDR7_9CRUS|nr:unnamed protein product [Notodromas monacha]CAG0918983.1 unnamed protein product [Notodromas monacha]
MKDRRSGVEESSHGTLGHKSRKEAPKPQWFVQESQPTWKLWGEQKASDIVYTIYLKKVRYHRPSKSVNSLLGLTAILARSDSEDEISHLEWETVKVRLVKAATLRRLVNSLACADTGELESTYVNIFLATYRTFASTDQVLDLLLQSRRLVNSPNSRKNQHDSCHPIVWVPQQLGDQTAVWWTGDWQGQGQGLLWLVVRPTNGYRQVEDDAGYTTVQSEEHGRMEKRGEESTSRAAASSSNDVHNHRGDEDEEDEDYGLGSAGAGLEPDQVRSAHLRALRQALAVWLDVYPSDFTASPNCLLTLVAFLKDRCPDDVHLQARALKYRQVEDDAGYTTVQSEEHGRMEKRGEESTSRAAASSSNDVHNHRGDEDEEDEDYGLGSAGAGLEPDQVRSAHLRALRQALAVWLDVYPSDFTASPNCLLTLVAFLKDRCPDDVHLQARELFIKLQPHQCLGAIWGKSKERTEVAGSVRATVDQFNAVSFRVLSTVLMDEALKPAQRAKIIAKWIEIAQELRLLKNFSSLKAIISGLQATPIYRLRKVWASVPKEKVESFEELARLFSEDNNQHAQREVLMREGTAKVAEVTSHADRFLPRLLQRHNPASCSVNYGTIPYLGTFLTDLTMINTAIPDKLYDNLINFDKKRKEFEILAQLKLLQGAAASYNIKFDPRFQKWFESCPVLEEKDCFHISCQIEPQGPLTPSRGSSGTVASTGSSGGGSGKRKPIIRKGPKNELRDPCDPYLKTCRGWDCLWIDHFDGLSDRRFSWSNTTLEFRGRAETRKWSRTCLASLVRAELCIRPLFSVGRIRLVNVHYCSRVTRRKTPAHHQKTDSITSTSSSGGSHPEPAMDSLPSSAQDSLGSLERKMSTSSTSSSSGPSSSTSGVVTTPPTGSSSSGSDAAPSSSKGRKDNQQQSQDRTPSSSTVTAGSSKSASPSPYRTPDFYIIRVSIETGSSEMEGVNLYKSIMLGNSERTKSVIASAMSKHGVEGKPEDYTLSQILPHGAAFTASNVAAVDENGGIALDDLEAALRKNVKLNSKILRGKLGCNKKKGASSFEWRAKLCQEMMFPPNANVYYAINTTYDLNFVLRRRKGKSASVERNFLEQVVLGTVGDWISSDICPLERKHDEQHCAQGSERVAGKSWICKSSESTTFTDATLADTLVAVKGAVDENGGIALDDLEATLRTNANLVEPVRISGPVSKSMSTSQGKSVLSRAGLHVMNTVTHPNVCASRSAPMTNGVRPLAPIPQTTSDEDTPLARKAAAPASALSSASSTLRCKAYCE